MPDATFGTVFYAKNWYGISVPQLLANNLDLKDKKDKGVTRRC